MRLKLKIIGIAIILVVFSLTIAPTSSNLTESEKDLKKCTRIRNKERCLVNLYFPGHFEADMKEKSNFTELENEIEFNRQHLDNYRVKSMCDWLDVLSDRKQMKFVKFDNQSGLYMYNPEQKVFINININRAKNPKRVKCHIIYGIFELNFHF
jgi:hypothetical protein